MVVGTQLRRMEEMQREITLLQRQLSDWEESEASVCPEDVGFVEFIGVLKAEIIRLQGWRQVAGVLNEYQAMTKELIDLNNPQTNMIVKRHLKAIPTDINGYDVCVKR